MCSILHNIHRYLHMHKAKYRDGIKVYLRIYIYVYTCLYINIGYTGSDIYSIIMKTSVWQKELKKTYTQRKQSSTVWDSNPETYILMPSALPTELPARI